MAGFGAVLARVAPGECEIHLPFRADLTQQHGYLHAGVVASIADSACGYAAMSLTPAGAAVLSAEFKINLLAPAIGERFVARGRVLKPGRMLHVCTGEVFAISGAGEPPSATVPVATGGARMVAFMVATIAVVRERPGLVD
jgi:uncharacterized protein (TIGR00369 family)